MDAQILLLQMELLANNKRIGVNALKIILSVEIFAELPAVDAHPPTVLLLLLLLVAVMEAAGINNLGAVETAVTRNLKEIARNPGSRTVASVKRRAASVLKHRFNYFILLLSPSSLKFTFLPTSLPAFYYIPPLCYSSAYFSS
jgi:hypothetical protein